MKMQVTRKFEISAAHKLKHEGPCKNLHGHNYYLEVTVEDNVDDDGFVIDFSDLKDIVEKNVINVLDHAYLNDIIPQPTAENIVAWAWNNLTEHLPLYELKLHETNDCYVTYRGN